MKRCATLALLVVLAGGAGAVERLPLRNLLIELRQGEASVLEADRAQAGAVVVGRDGSVSARAGISLDSHTLRRDGEAVQQLRVLNGARAALRVGAQQPLYWVQWAASPDGPVALLGNAWVDTGRSVTVLPRWPGGDAPVTVELLAESAARAGGGAPTRYAPDGQPLPEGAVERTGVLTTLQLPLGAWTTVAASGEAGQRRERGTLSTQDGAGDRRWVVQMRVTAP